MKCRFLGGVAAVALLAGSPALADGLLKVPAFSGPSNWSGFYAGVTAGAAWGSFDPRVATGGGPGADFYLFANEAAAVTAAGAQRISPLGFEAGVEGGYNWQVGRFVLGIEADLQSLHFNGAANSGATPYPGFPANSFTVSSYADANWMLTVRPRVGLTADNWLFYATGGLAVTHLNGDFLFIDNNGAQETANLSTTKTGYAVGAGVESRLSDRLSVKAEYLHVGFGRAVATNTGNNLLDSGFTSQTFAHSADLSADIVRVGLNYRFGGGPSGAYAMAYGGPNIGAQWLDRSNWEVETGTRLWLSSGTIGAPQPLLNRAGTNLLSRLTFKDEDAVSGEVFGRVDHSSGFFVKANLGAGGITHGNMFDEDFPAFTAYSRTQQNNNTGGIGYATIDLGYSVIKTPEARIGPFVGYNYYRQQVSTFNCTQLAGDGECGPGNLVQPNILGISEDDHFQSLRVGLSTQFMLTDRLRLTGDAAYLPRVKFGGQDDHNIRQLIQPEASNSGDGAMLEAVLDYRVTDAWNVGVGARYWAWNMNTGTATFNFLGVAGPSSVQPARFNTERYGGFLQASYHWGDTRPAYDSAMPVKAPLARAPMSWTGAYVGGHLGGGWSDDRWSDPFGSNFLAAGNVAGFGDTTHATGPLGGGQIGFNLQRNAWVFGVQADVSAADLRGENTCFSGLGGVNCTRTIDSLGTITGRVGYSGNRALGYVKGGAAWAHTDYGLNANTGALTLGTGNTSATPWGWTVGGGFEYGLTDHWTTFVEYDHIEIPGTTVAFPTVALINAQNISVRQGIEVVKLGANYKFDLAALGSAFGRH